MVIIKVMILLLAVSVLINYVLQLLEHKDITQQLEIVHIQLMDMIEYIDNIACKVDELNDVKKCGR